MTTILLNFRGSSYVYEPLIQLNRLSRKFLRARTASHSKIFANSCPDLRSVVHDPADTVTRTRPASGQFPTWSLMT